MESSSRGSEKTAERRGFPLRAAAVSLFLHALLLAAWEPPPAVVEVPDTALRGTLRPPRGAPPPSLPPLPRPHQRSDRPAAPAKPAPPPAPPSATPVLVASPDSAAPPAVPPAPTFPAAGTSAAEVSASRPEARPDAAPDTAGLRQFRLALAGEARRFRRYPEAARRQGLAGTAEISVAVAADGVTRRAELVQSSGHEVLDAAALEMMRQAAGRAELPESLRGRDFTVRLPVVFEVGD